MLFRHFKGRYIKDLILEYALPIYKKKQRKNSIVMLYEILWLFYKQKFWPHNYLKFKGYEKQENVRELLHYIPGRLFDSLREDILNDPKSINLVENKYLFNRVLRWSGSPATNVYGRYVRDVGFFDYENRLLELDNFLESINNDFVIKPVLNSAQGSGVKIIRLAKVVGKSFVAENVKMDIEHFKKYLKDVSAGGIEGILFEQRIEQHPQQAKIYKDSVNTIRIDTLRCRNGKVMIIGPFLRTGRRGREVDNWHFHHGGIAIGIDKERGCLRKIGYDYALNEYCIHPDSQFCFENVKIPFWNELVHVVTQAASVFPGINSIGWDVAIGKNGPIIIEGNADYSLQSVQVTNGPYFKKREFIAALQEYIKNSKFKSRYGRYFALR